MWEDSRYFWVVFCRNNWFHVRRNLFFRHKILLGETDAITPRPALGQRFKARCDECGKEYTYKPSEVLRVEQEPPEEFKPHPLFRDEDSGPHPVVEDINDPPSSMAEVAPAGASEQPGEAKNLRRPEEGQPPRDLSA